MTAVGGNAGVKVTQVGITSIIKYRRSIKGESNIDLRENRLEDEADRIKERREQFCKMSAKPKDKRAAIVFQLSTSCLINYMSLLITRAKKGEADEKHMIKQ